MRMYGDDDSTWDLRQQRRNALGGAGMGSVRPVTLDGSGSGAIYTPPKTTTVPTLPVQPHASEISTSPMNPIDPMTMGMGGVRAASNPGDMGMDGPITPGMVNRVRRQGW